MSQSQVGKAEAAEERTEQTRSFVRRVRAATRRKYIPEEKIRIVLEGFRREVTVNDLCRREGIKPHSTAIDNGAVTRGPNSTPEARFMGVVDSRPGTIHVL